MCGSARELLSEDDGDGNEKVDENIASQIAQLKMSKPENIVATPRPKSLSTTSEEDATSNLEKSDSPNV